MWTSIGGSIKVFLHDLYIIITMQMLRSSKEWDFRVWFWRSRQTSRQLQHECDVGAILWGIHKDNIVMFVAGYIFYSTLSSHICLVVNAYPWQLIFSSVNLNAYNTGSSKLPLKAKTHRPQLWKINVRPEQLVGTEEWSALEHGTWKAQVHPSHCWSWCALKVNATSEQPH